MGSADLVFFAIRAALRLGDAARQAYVDTTRRRAVTLPLPAVTVSPAAAIQWFATKGVAHVAGESELARLYRDATSGPLVARDRAAEKLLPFYREYWHADRAARGEQVRLGDTDLTPAEWLALFRVRQLGRGEDEAANRTLLTRTIGTVVEVGVDYFASVPGALREDSRRGRVLGAAVAALDRVEFAAIDAGRAGWLGDLAGRLVVAALETVGEAPEAIARDDRVRELVGVAAAALAEDVKGHVEAGTFAKLRLGEWADTVFRGLLASAGEKVLAEPDRYLGVADAGRGALIRKAGGAVLSLVTADGGLDPLRVVSREGVETILAASLEALADHPELLGDPENGGLRKILAETSRALASFEGLLTPDVFPEMVRLLLERTGENLELVWPGGAEDPAKHLLLTAAKTTLGILVAPAPAGAAWTATFRGEDVTAVVTAVVDELAGNPAWLLERAEAASDDLGAALAATLAAIRNRGEGKLLSRNVAVGILRAAVTAAAARRELLEDLGPAGEPLVAAAVDAVLATIFGADDRRARWQLLRDEAVVAAIVLSLDRLADARIDRESVARLRAAWGEIAADLADGGPLEWEAAGAAVERALAGEE